MKKGDSSWSALYLLIVLVIAAVLITTVIKPMFNQSQEAVTSKKLPSSMGLIGLAGVVFSKNKNLKVELKESCNTPLETKSMIQNQFTISSSMNT